MDDIFQRTLRLSLPAVGIAFRDSPPAGVPHAAAGPASCSYWKRAAEGEVFWTDAGDHQNCPIGAHTHGVQMREARQQELMGLVGTMVQLGYTRMDEVPAMPHRKAPLLVAVSGPLAQMHCPPDRVRARGRKARMIVIVGALIAALPSFS